MNSAGAVALRRAGFWVRDRLAGGPIRTQLRDIEFLHSRDDFRSHREESLTRYLRHLRETVPFYSERLTPASRLTDLPVVDKDMLREHTDRFISSEFDIERAHVTSTSGSTGIPLRVYQDRARRSRVNAEAIHFGTCAGYAVGSRLYHMKIWTDRNNYGLLARIARNVTPVDTRNFDVDGALRFLNEIATSRQPVGIIAYGSVLETIGRALKEHPEHAAKVAGLVKSVIGQSEPFSLDARTSIAKHLGVHPVGRYGLEELGIVAQQSASEDTRYWLNRATHVVEILDSERDVPVEPGETGRIVVTDLFNRAQAVARYDTGDLGAFDPETVIDGMPIALASIDGRSADRIFDTEDRPLAPMIAYAFWWRFPELKRYQLVQDGRGVYQLRIDVDASFKRDGELAEALKQEVGASAKIDVIRTETGFLRASGKQRSVVSNYRPEAAS